MPTFPTEIFDRILYFAFSNRWRPLPFERPYLGRGGTSRGPRPAPSGLEALSSTRRLPALTSHLYLPLVRLVLFFALDDGLLVEGERGRRLAGLVRHLAINSGADVPTLPCHGQGFSVVPLNISHLINLQRLAWFSSHVTDSCDPTAIREEVAALQVNNGDDDGNHAGARLWLAVALDLDAMRAVQRPAFARSLVSLPRVSTISISPSDYCARDAFYVREACDTPSLMDDILASPSVFPLVTMHLHSLPGSDRLQPIFPSLYGTLTLSILFDKYPSASVVVHDVEDQEELKNKIQAGGVGVGWKWIESPILPQ